MQPRKWHGPKSVGQRMCQSYALAGALRLDDDGIL